MIILCTHQRDKFYLVKMDSLTEFIENFYDMDLVIKIYDDEEGLTAMDVMENSLTFEGEDLIIMTRNVIQYAGKEAHQALFDYNWLRDAIPLYSMMGLSNIEKVYITHKHGKTIDQFLLDNSQQLEVHCDKLIEQINKELNYGLEIKEQFTSILDNDFKLVVNSDRPLVENIHRHMEDEIGLEIDSKLEKLDNIKQFKNMLKYSANCFS